MNEQPKKRTSPFDKPKFIEEEAENTVNEYEEVIHESYAPQQVVEEQPRSYQYSHQVQKQTRKQVKPQYIPTPDMPKDKYTATMDVDLRRKIKIYCATNGKMFSEFVEEACREKLLREGVK